MQVHSDLHVSLKSTRHAGEISYADEILPDEIAAAKGRFHFIVCRAHDFIRTVSIRIFILVLLPQAGQRSQVVL